ncbi:hypothetical protein C8Q70DRAFT_1054041 [Cubamyces menziesii]|nr:hypothetical protein C8Q70DRAFT_1054041 [Cubamyces menziesii]
MSPTEYLEDDLFPNVDTTTAGTRTPAPDSNLQDPLTTALDGTLPSPYVTDQGTGLDDYILSTPAGETTPEQARTPKATNPARDAATAPPGAPTRIAPTPFLPNESDLADPALPLKRLRANSSPSPAPGQAQARRAKKIPCTPQHRLALTTLGTSSLTIQDSAIRSTAEDDTMEVDKTQNNNDPIDWNAPAPSREQPTTTPKQTAGDTMATATHHQRTGVPLNAGLHPAPAYMPPVPAWHAQNAPPPNQPHPAAPAQQSEPAECAEEPNTPPQSSCLKGVSASQRVQELNNMGIPIARAPGAGFKERHMLDPADYLRGVSDSAKAKYIDTPENNRVIIQTPNQLTNDEVELEIEAIKFALTVIGSENCYAFERDS